MRKPVKQWQSALGGAAAAARRPHDHGTQPQQAQQAAVASAAPSADACAAGQTHAQKASQFSQTHYAAYNKSMQGD
jgi:hypothetical protein